MNFAHLEEINKHSKIFFTNQKAAETFKPTSQQSYIGFCERSKAWTYWVGLAGLCTYYKIIDKSGKEVILNIPLKESIATKTA